MWSTTRPVRPPSGATPASEQRAHGDADRPSQGAFSFSLPPANRRTTASESSPRLFAPLTLNYLPLLGPRVYAVSKRPSADRRSLDLETGARAANRIREQVAAPLQIPTARPPVSDKAGDLGLRAMSSQRIPRTHHSPLYTAKVTVFSFLEDGIR